MARQQRWTDDQLDVALDKIVVGCPAGEVAEDVRSLVAAAGTIAGSLGAFPSLEAQRRHLRLIGQAAGRRGA